MKKLLMSLALVGTFAAMSAKGDSYMYWMVQDAKQGGDPLLFDAAELYAINGSQKVSLGANYAIDSSGEMGVGSSTKRNLAGGAGSDLTSYDVSTYANSDWSFLVELYNGEVWVSESRLSYAQVASGFYEHLAPSGAGVATFTSFNVPEPTSGLLMLIGLCGLALKRKRA